MVVAFLDSRWFPGFTPGSQVRDGFPGSRWVLARSKGRAKRGPVFLVGYLLLALLFVFCVGFVRLNLRLHGSCVRSPAWPVRPLAPPARLLARPRTWSGFGRGLGLNQTLDQVFDQVFCPGLGLGPRPGLDTGFHDLDQGQDQEPEQVHDFVCGGNH